MRHFIQIRLIADMRYDRWVVAMPWGDYVAEDSALGATAFAEPELSKTLAMLKASPFVHAVNAIKCDFNVKEMMK